MLSLVVHLRCKWDMWNSVGYYEGIGFIDVADSNTVYYYHFDGLGSVIALSDQNADLVESYSYDVFGKPSNTSDVNNPFMFTGRRYDDETGLYYYRARYYDYATGRFLQTDPIGYVDSMNLYTYVSNNPIRFVDPYGLSSDSTDWIPDSKCATVLVVLDVLGIYGEFGQQDTFDPDIMDAIINPYPDIAPEVVESSNEKFYSYAHKGTGIILGLLGIDETSAINLMKAWEQIEPGVWTYWGELAPYQGRDVFEGGDEGIDMDIKDGMEGYEIGSSIKDVSGLLTAFL